MLEEARQQDLVEVGVLDAHDGLVGAAQAAPVEHGVTGRDVERSRDTGAGLLARGRAASATPAASPAPDLLGERGEPAGGPRRLGDEGATAGDPLEEALGDEGVERLAHGHAGHAETGHELALGRGGGAGWLGLDEAPHVLAHLDVLERSLAGYDELHRFHTPEGRTGLYRQSAN